MARVRVRVDGSGRVVIPQAIRRDFGVEHGGHLILVDQGGRLELRRDPNAVTVVDEGGFPVLDVTGDARFTDEDVRAARDENRPV